MCFIILEKQNGLKIVNTNFTFLIKVKCNKYWPDKDNPTFYGPVQVILIDEKEYACFTTRKLSVLNKQVTLVLVYSTKETCTLINITCVCTIFHILYCIYSKLSYVYQYFDTNFCVANNNRGVFKSDGKGNIHLTIGHTSVTFKLIRFHFIC